MSKLPNPEFFHKLWAQRPEELIPTDPFPLERLERRLLEFRGPGLGGKISQLLEFRDPELSGKTSQPQIQDPGLGGKTPQLLEFQILDRMEKPLSSWNFRILN